MSINKLIIEIGSTKADWVYLSKSAPETCRTIGFNPLTHEPTDLVSSIQEVKEQLTLDYPLSIYYYGSGISTKTTPLVSDMFNKHFAEAEVHVTNDLLAAARAVCQSDPGIVCISGTGSNACVYDGEQIVDKINSLGYILGDEGSGNHLARMLLRDYFYHLLPSHLTDAFNQHFTGFNKNDFLDKLYKEDMPNTFLASFTRFLGDHNKDIYIRSLVTSCFREFIRFHVLPFYSKYRLPVYMIGSIAHYFKKEWISVLEDYSLEIGRFVQKPIEGLIEYHQFKT